MSEPIITEKDEMLKTKMCKSIEEGRKCVNGDNCRFAHSIDQLSIKECIFKERCTFVRCQETDNGVNYSNNNTKQKLCQFLHPRETIENYLARINVTKQTVMPSLLRNTQANVPIQRPMSHVKASENGSWTRIVRKVVKHPNLLITELEEEVESGSSDIGRSVNQEIIVKVPKDAVESALRAILESGKSNVRLEIV